MSYTLCSEGQADKSKTGTRNMDNLLQSFENLLNYANAEHGQDHSCGYIHEKPKDCITCNWLADANKNFTKLANLVGK
jgi:hypothetical protein